MRFWNPRWRWSLLLWWLCSSVALADAVSLTLHRRGEVGKSPPAIDVHIIDSITGFDIELQRSDGKKLSFKGNGNRGTTRVIDLVQPEGQLHYTGELTVSFPNGGSASTPVEFDAELLGPLKLQVDKKNVDIPNRRATFTLSRPAKKIHARVVMDTGIEAVDRDFPFNGEDAGTPLSITWPFARGQVMTIELKAYDTSDFYTGVEMSPWQVAIPHDEINFDTAKWEIRKEEQPKLDRSFDQIAEAVKKFGSLASVKLYIVGHTDTVGSSESNRPLSVNRARSIGQYLRKRGARIPIFYEGFGEEALLVATHDETDEPKNRRAEYILAIDEPLLPKAPFPPVWHPL